jgi:hypothetical protein
MSDWQPIETAPKDGTRMLVRFVNEWKRPCYALAAYFPAGALDMDDEYPGGIDEEGHNADAGWFEDSDLRDPGYWEMTAQPTHWMPLPDPPTPTEVQG